MLFSEFTQMVYDIHKIKHTQSNIKLTDSGEYKQHLSVLIVLDNMHGRSLIYKRNSNGPSIEP